MSPLRFFRNIFEAMTVAFTTVSSSATLPINMKNCQDNLKLRPEIVSFVLPLGANINMDGTAIYIGVSTIFAANLYGVDFSWGQMLIIVLTGTLGSIGAAGVPGAAVIMLATVLQSVGLPLEAIAIIAGVDRFTDMFATCLNITGDATVAAVINENENRREIMP
jgi:Na+/H+-dicarboxylate symporter